MNMKRRVFLAHDPGGYDVIYPVFQRFKQAEEYVELYCLGPAGKLNPEFAASEQRLNDIFTEPYYKNIRTVISGTSWGNDTELWFVQSAKAYGITTVSILDYWSNYALRLKDQEQTFVYPDYYIVMDSLAKQEAIADGVPEAIIYCLGHPGLDSIIQRRKNERTILPLSNKVLFLCQPISQLYRDTLGYTEQSVLADFVKLFTSLKWDFDIKFHPKDDVVLQNTYASFAVQGNLLDLLPNYRLVISMNSMGLLHAVLLGISSISYQPNLAKQDMCITNKLGFTPLATSYQQLSEMVWDLQVRSRVENDVLQPSEKFIWLDGCSTERIYRFIEGL